ncbi:MULTISPECIES: hypothetical protein [Paraburkholderia]|uniref:hypothetical protein n=1 Tax=Paraburkholderia TaxID=1822464 RepID=UPI0022517BF3|nr:MULTISPECIES: hypothetical protein [Paraburkholderia]MCX4155001.1 hypothetical protein [Paraburkholderia aspalathi]MDN7164411.1 hypothetical protein [Paraburkholderia sp. SECH2]MDQ6392896.1 hypothetical protein [Paraburkholderia aspalathi]
MGYLNSFSYDDEDFAATAATNGTTDPPTPSWTSGLATAIPRGLLSALGKTVAASGELGQTGSGPGSMAPELEMAQQAGTAGNPFTDYSKLAPEVSKAAGDAMTQFATPRPGTQGGAAQMVQGITEGAALGVGGSIATGSPIGGAVLMGGVEGASTYDEMRKQGVDENTALEEGLVSGAVNAASAFIPMRFASSGLVTSLLTGAGVNTVLGAAQRGTTGAILQAHGYTQMASQYKILDWNSVASDALLGAVFGGVGKVMHGINPQEVLPTDIDQAQVIQSEQHLTRDGAPGIPTDPQTEALHAQTSQDALEALALRGEAPDIQSEHAELLAKDLVADPRKDDAAPQALDEQFTKDMPGVDLETEAPLMRPADELEAERVAAMPPARAEVEETPEALAGQPVEQQAQGPQMSGIHQEMLSQLETAHGDMPIDFGDGVPRTIADVRQLLADSGVQAQKDSALHDVAAACFMRGM